MHKYINSFSLHFYIIVALVMFILSFEEPSLCTWLIAVLLLLPLILSYLYRIKNMPEEEIVEKFGFKGNKFLDPNIV